MPYIAPDPKIFFEFLCWQRSVRGLRPSRGTGRTHQHLGRGVRVQDQLLPIGTAIATFGDNQRYKNDSHGRSHAAIYLGQTAVGIQVLDQWRHKRTLPDGTTKDEIHVVQERTIFFQEHVKPVDDGRKYYVID